MNWTIHHRAETGSTNQDALSGRPGDVYTADFQRAGRGRLDHRWLSPPGANLMLSAVLDVADIAPVCVATLPLAVGLAVIEALKTFNAPQLLALKWPNDIWADERKICGILCERHGDNVIVGLGVNVNQLEFPPELADRATSLRLCGIDTDILTVRGRVLESLAAIYSTWRHDGFAALRPRLVSVDALRGRIVSVRRTDDDPRPANGLCGGILPDGALDVAGEAIYAGEAHVATNVGM